MYMQQLLCNLKRKCKAKLLIIASTVEICTVHLEILLVVLIVFLSYDVVSGSEITPCNKIDKLLVDYRFSGNVMTL